MTPPAVSPPPTGGDPRPREPRDANQPPARGTRGGGYAEAAGAPAGVAPASGPAKAATAAGAAAAATAPRKTPAPAVVPPTPVPFPPDDLKAACEALIARYPQRAAALIPILHLAQKRFDGWISPEVEAGVAQYLGVSDQHVRGVVTFYTMFNTKPVGRHHVQVCRTLSCWLRGAGELTRCLERKTGLRPGQTDEARRFTVSEVECLGLCEVAPALFVNEDAHVNVTPEGLEKLLDGLK
ncbi:MAG: NAD(P)H-dependent oxidoreductase subunit E [Planctomycetia bacterium]|nr:NAD(P)H-dependent oxidoreductase subunit E [Planctomycetia bacterium]